MRFQKTRTIVTRLLGFALLLLGWYVTCFFLMRDWRLNAFDFDRQSWTTGSGYLFAKPVYVQLTCAVNPIFGPIDLEVDRLRHTAGFYDWTGTPMGRIVFWSFFLGALFLPLMPVRLQMAVPCERHRLRVVVILLSIEWYCGQVCLYHSIRMDHIRALIWISRSPAWERCSRWPGCIGRRGREDPSALCRWPWRR